MLKSITQRIPPTTYLAALIAVVVLIVALTIGLLIGGTGLTYQGLLVIGGSMTLAALALHRRGIELGFLIWIGMFVLGYRVVRLNTPLLIDQIANGGVVSPSYWVTGSTPQIQLHPLVLIAFALFVLLVVREAFSGRKQLVWQIPRLLLPFSLFWAWGWLQGVNRGYSWPAMFAELLPFLMIIPVFVVTASILHVRPMWKAVLLTFFAAGTFIAFGGVLELLFPNIRNVFPGLIENEGPFVRVAQDGFQRVQFLFWGHPSAIFVTGLSLFFVIPLWASFKGRTARLMLVVCVVLQIIGIYIAGYRSLWALTAGLTLIMLIIRGKWAWIILLILGAFVIYGFLPAETKLRIDSFVSAIEGDYEDTSTAKRAERITDGLSQVLQRPLGMGWTGSGLVHNDFLQITGNLGVMAGVLFGSWYLSTLFRMNAAYRHVPSSLGLSLLGAILMVGGLLLMQPMVYLPQFAMPVWFVWALVETYLRNPPSVKEA